MAALRYSSAAEADLESITEYTLRTWGAARADLYLAALETCCESLATNPMLGRACDEVAPGCGGWKRAGTSSSIVFTEVGFA